MVYKKYIEKGGKVYGPYIYHSKRVDGKVVSEYRGPHRQIEYRKILFIILGIFLLTAFILGIVFNKGISGRAILNIHADYKEGEPLKGNLELSLKEGEFMPASSKLIFESGENKYEYSLQELISEEPVEGNFYVEGQAISGNGSGYGKEGVLEIFYPVYFTLEVYNSQESGETEPSPPIPEQNETLNITGQNETTATPEQNETLNVPEQNETVDIVEENKTENQITSEENPAEEVIEPVEQTEITETAAEETETSAAEEPISEPAPITGGVIARFFKNFGMTGRVVMELETEINGEVSADSPFVYELKEGQSAELKPKSVRTDSQELPDDTIKVKTENNQVIVTTDYGERKNGFGEEYLGNSRKILVIDLADLNLRTGKELKISLVYGEKEIILLDVDLENGKAESTLEQNQTSNITEQNQTLNITEQKTEPEKLFLTEEEKTVLSENFGDSPVTTIRSEIFNRRLIRGYEFGGYKIEYSYDYPQDESILKLQMEADIIRWKKEIVKTILAEKIIPEQVEIGKGEY